MSRVLTFRATAEQRERMRIVCQVQKISTAELVRRSIDSYLDRPRIDGEPS